MYMLNKRCGEVGQVISNTNVMILYVENIIKML